MVPAMSRADPIMTPFMKKVLANKAQTTAGLDQRTSEINARYNAAGHPTIRPTTARTYLDMLYEDDYDAITEKYGYE